MIPVPHMRIASLQVVSALPQGKADPGWVGMDVGGVRPPGLPALSRHELNQI